MIGVFIVNRKYYLLLQAEQHLPPQSLLHDAQHWVPQVLQVHVEVLFAPHVLPHPLNQSYMPCRGPLSLHLPCSPAIAESVPATKKATMANTNILFTIGSPFYYRDNVSLLLRVVNTNRSAVLSE